MAWYYVLSGASHGPVPETEIRRLHEQNVVALDTPVWTDGMAEWLPFSSSPLAVGAVPPAFAPQAGATHVCAECGKSFAEDQMLNYEGSWVCAACKPVFFQRVKEGVAPKGSLVYASVGQRFLAILIDGFIVGAIVTVPAILLGIVAGASQKAGDSSDAVSGWFLLLFGLLYLLPPIYEIFMIGKYGATFGKMAMKIKVMRPDGSPVSYLRSTGRYFAKILSGMILYIGFLMAFWDEEKCALHDRMCQTRVTRVQPT